MQKPSLDLQQQSARTLASGYSSSIRQLERGSITAYCLLLGALIYRLLPWVSGNRWLLLAAFITGYLGADFISGFVHWLADTWGSVDMPFIGKALLRPFREHHVDQEAITRHDFVETNGNNCLISVPVLLGAVLLPLGADKQLNLFVAAFTGSLVVWVLGTNQFHKWAHLRTPPRWITLLQRLHLVLPPAHHAIHHSAPFNSYYSITTGWMNWPLSAIRFYPTLEALVTWTFGMLPRKDDIGERAALQVAEVIPSAPGELGASASAPKPS